MSGRDNKGRAKMKIPRMWSYMNDRENPRLCFAEFIKNWMRTERKDDYGNI
jgi:hypothetical protein